MRTVIFTHFQMQRNLKMGKISQDVFTQQSIEILAALRKLGEKVRSQKGGWSDRVDCYAPPPP